MITNITPIRTCVSDTTYRSRLEAKWAIFFAALGIRFKYEPLNLLPLLCGTTYLPDFFLEREQVVIEIKPRSGVTADPVRYREFADVSGFPVLCIKGEPRPDCYAITLYPPRFNRRLYQKFTAAQFAEGAYESNRLWLIQDSRFCRVAKFWNLRQTKGSTPIPDSDWLREAFAEVVKAEHVWASNQSSNPP